MDELVEIFLNLSMKTVQVHLIIGTTLVIMVNTSFGWKVLKMHSLSFLFLLLLKRFDTVRGYLKVKRKSSYAFIFSKGISYYF